MKYVNMILMVAMALLAVREGMEIAQHGPSPAHVLFAILFATFAVRRFMLMSKCQSTPATRSDTDRA